MCEAVHSSLFIEAEINLAIHHMRRAVIRRIAQPDGDRRTGVCRVADILIGQADRRTVAHWRYGGMELDRLTRGIVRIHVEKGECALERQIRVFVVVPVERRGDRDIVQRRLQGVIIP